MFRTSRIAAVPVFILALDAGCGPAGQTRQTDPGSAREKGADQVKKSILRLGGDLVGKTRGV
ncbi:MAG: hypothetical protein K6T65_05365 [Peptococcaceae bacterium]|nr:hypothetical protein [Peptococcaceae bacterium]